MSIDLFEIPNLIEPFNDPALGFNPANPKIIDGRPADLYQWTQDQISGVMKLLAINLNYVNVQQLLSMGNFDRVVVVERKNLTDCCVSLCLAEQTGRYHYWQGESPNIQQFECSEEFVDNWIGMYRRYLQALDQIHASAVPYDTICYEDFIDDKIQHIAGVPLQASRMSYKVFNTGKKMMASNLPYRDLCINYNEVEKKIRKELC